MSESGAEGVRSVTASWTGAIERADLAALAGLMAHDIVVVHGDGRMLQGRSAVLADIGSSLRDFHVSQRVTFDETIVAGDWAFDRSTVRTTITPRAAGTARVVVSRTFTLLRRAAGGDWAIARTMGVVISERSR